MNSSRFRHLDLTQIPRSPGAYGRSIRLEMTPSRPSLQDVLAKAGAVTDDVLAIAQSLDFLLEQLLQPLFALDQRQLSRALAIQVQQVKRKEEQLIRARF